MPKKMLGLLQWKVPVVLQISYLVLKEIQGENPVKGTHIKSLLLSMGKISICVWLFLCNHWHSKCHRFGRHLPIISIWNMCLHIWKTCHEASQDSGWMTIESVESGSSGELRPWGTLDHLELWQVSSLSFHTGTPSFIFSSFVALLELLGLMLTIQCSLSSSKEKR